ncbi:MAG: ATP-binding protein [Deltaproteobacteria bacterium]|nr:ATP-binding protein [Deltaproteobacteria bacterium]
MYLKRSLNFELCRWQEHPGRKPLVLLGARQVGKTAALKSLAKERYENIAYLNFEERPLARDLFRTSLAPAEVLKALSLELKTTIKPGKTLLVFDEVQEAPEALTSLKYFCEDAPEFHVAAAGSLLGVKVKQGSGFPVGKVDFIQVHPLSFTEFLGAMDETALVDMLVTKSNWHRLPESIHERLLTYLKIYMLTGGMPEIVAIYSATKDWHSVRGSQQAILRAYELDMAKHAPAMLIPKLYQVWQSILPQLSRENRKFKYSDVASGARARSHEDALQWLIDAGLLIKCCNLDAVKLPLASYANQDHFKIYLLDCGLLSAIGNIDPESFLQGQRLLSEFRGAFTENFVAQELVCNRKQPIHYWSSNNKAEIDFVVEDAAQIFPLEVKAGINLQSKSLAVFLKRFDADIACRASAGVFARNPPYDDYPLYGLTAFPRLSATAP